MKNTREIFRTNLRAIIDSKGLKLEKAAELCDISLSLLNQILAGKTAYSPETIDKITEGLSCSTEELFASHSSHKSSRAELLLAIQTDIIALAALDEGELRSIRNIVADKLSAATARAKRSSG